MKSLILLLVSLLLAGFVIGQKPVDLMLKTSQSRDKASCFDILLRSAAGNEIDLAGQNYRLFYDQKKMTFLSDRITHNLDKKTYSKIDLLNTVDHNIGFVSISIDGKDLTDKVIHLKSDGSWQKSINICFDRSTDQPYDLTWANPKKTSLYATVEVALSEWVDKKSQQVLTPNEVYDFSSLENNRSFSNNVDLNIFPNPVIDNINIRFKGEPIQGRILIKDVIGRELVRERINGEMYLDYNLERWPEGAYTVVVLDEDGKRLLSQKVIKIDL